MTESDEAERWLRLSAAAALLDISRWSLDRHAAEWGIATRTWPGPRRERRYREADVRRLAREIAEGRFERPVE